MSSKDKIWQYLITHDNQATNAQLADWLRGSKGQLSWGQRLRELRQELQAKGGDLTCRELRPGIYLYKIIEPHKETQMFTQPTGQMAWIGGGR